VNANPKVKSRQPCRHIPQMKTEKGAIGKFGAKRAVS